MQCWRYVPSPLCSIAVGKPKEDGLQNRKKVVPGGGWGTLSGESSRLIRGNRLMRHRLYGGTALLSAALLLACPSAGKAQETLFGFDGFGGAAAADYPVPGQPGEQIPLPTGDPGTHGFYTFFEFMYLSSYRTLGEQTIAYRGLVDSTGRVTTIPGIYIGSGRPALSTRDLPQQSFLPGFNIGIGYKLDDGTSIYASYIYLANRRHHAGATQAAPFFRSATDLSDTYLVAGVFNFPPQYAGPPISTSIEESVDGNIFSGIWNAATIMDIDYTQRFAHGEIGARVPMFQTEYSRIYGLAGGRFDWIFERFQWRTVKLDVNGVGAPFWNARYNNTLSQRMYGPYIGFGHEVYVGKRFSISGDLSAAGLLNIVKERAKYKLEDNTIQNKYTRDDFTLVPSIAGNIQLWWYPFQGVQIRAGYNAWTYFNTRRMEEPVGFNYSAIDPAYDVQVFRIVHGLNVGLGLFF
jgi:hypothetical protein